MALLKLVYLATRRIERKWTSPLQNWGLTVQQLAIKFEEVKVGCRLKIIISSFPRVPLGKGRESLANTPHVKSALFGI